MAAEISLLVLHLLMFFSDSLSTTFIPFPSILSISFVNRSLLVKLCYIALASADIQYLLCLFQPCSSCVDQSIYSLPFNRHSEIPRSQNPAESRRMSSTPRNLEEAAEFAFSFVFPPNYRQILYKSMPNCSITSCPKVSNTF